MRLLIIIKNLSMMIFSEIRNKYKDKFYPWKYFKRVSWLLFIHIRNRKKINWIFLILVFLSILTITFSARYNWWRIPQSYKKTRVLMYHSISEHIGKRKNTINGE